MHLEPFDPYGWIDEASASTARIQAAGKFKPQTILKK